MEHQVTDGHAPEEQNVTPLVVYGGDRFTSFGLYTATPFVGGERGVPTRSLEDRIEVEETRGVFPFVH